MSRRSEMIRITAASLVPRRGLACIAMRPPHGDSDPRLGAVSVRKHIPESRRFDVEHPLADLGLRRLGPRRIMHRTTIKCRSSTVVRVTMVQTCDLARNGGLFTRYPRRTLAFEGFDLDARGAILAIRGENNLWLEVEMSRCRAFAHTLILCSLFAGCEKEEDDSAPLGATEERIIGGFPARSPSLNAVGAIGFPTYSEDFGNDLDTSLSRRRYIDRRMQIGERSSYYPYCTATLIAPNAILTAEHCVDGLVGDEEFLIGFDATQPTKHVKITGLVVESTIEGGFIGYGSDVAVALLEEPITDIAPLPYRTLSPSDVGTSYIGIGYGLRNNFGDAGQRYLGEMMLRGIGGNHALNIWGSVKAYLAHYHELGIPDPPMQILPLFKLLDQYEASVGMAPGNAQDCYGDSGGPLARMRNNQLEVFGVVSGGLGSADLVCDWGGVYSIFGPAALETIDRAVGCGTVPAESVCTGVNTISRCAPPEEGGYHVVETDCSLLGMVCGEDELGQIGCIPDPCEGLPEEGTCEGDTAVRCSGPGEGNRRVLQVDCSLLGGTCGFDDTGDVACLGVQGGSCHGYCGGVSPGIDGVGTCYCDAVCQSLGDCCSDYELVCDPGETSGETDGYDTDGYDTDGFDTDDSEVTTVASSVGDTTDGGFDPTYGSGESGVVPQ